MIRPCGGLSRSLRPGSSSPADSAFTPGAPRGSSAKPKGRSSASGFRWLYSAKRWLLALLLILILPSWIGCSTVPTQTPTLDAARAMICKAGNPAQLASYGRIVTLSKLPGDPNGVGTGTLWVGAIVKRCFPELFRKR